MTTLPDAARAADDRPAARVVDSARAPARPPRSGAPRHTLVDQRGEWQQRIQAALYHHGCPQRHGLLTGENRRWLEGLGLPAGAREQVTVALAMIDAVDRQEGSESSPGTWCKARRSRSSVKRSAA